jgi:hypothetical protein
MLKNSDRSEGNKVPIAQQVFFLCIQEPQKKPLLYFVNIRDKKAQC